MHDVKFYAITHVLTPLLAPGEGQEAGYITFPELRQRVATIAGALRGMGVTKGDRVVGEHTLYQLLVW